MSNDVSYFKVKDDDTLYSFDDADAEVRISDETDRAEAAEGEKVAKAGDTMTGALTIKNSITEGETPSTNAYGTSLYFVGNNDGRFATLQPVAYTAGTQGIYIVGSRTVNGSRVNNGLSLLVDSNGNPVVSLSQVAWQSALGITTTSGTYTPTIAWSTSGSPTVATGGTYQWIRSGNVMMIHGRFNITALNAPSTAGGLTITLPSGISVVNSVAAVGALYKTYSANADFVGRVASASGPIEFSTSAGGSISGAMQTGWHNFEVTVFVA